MGTHIVKTTIEIADDLFEKVQRLAAKEKTTFRQLTESGLRLVIAGRAKARAKALPPLVTFGNAAGKPAIGPGEWDRIRDEIYRGHGA